MSIETIFELSILLNGTVDLDSLDGIKISELDNFKFDSLKPIFDFIKKHKSENNNAGNIYNYIYLIDYFIGLESVKTCSVKDFWEVMKFDFAGPKTYGNISKCELLFVIKILSNIIDKDESQCGDAARVVNDILDSEQKKIWLDKIFIDFTVKLLKKLKKQRVDITIDCTKIMNNYFTQLPPEKFDFGTWLVLLSGCKDNSVDKKTLDILTKNKKNLLETAFLPFGYSLYEDEISQIKTKYGKYIFTPSLINFIRQKFNFDKDYGLENILKANFETDNFVEGNDCDLSAILYRLCFECGQCIPHEKQDIIKLFESTKLFLPENYKCNNDDQYSKVIKEKIDHDLRYASTACYKNKIYEELDKCVEQIFIEKGVLQKDEDNNSKIESESVNEQSSNSKILTLEELKIIVLSNFKFTAGDQPNAITKEQFVTLIPNKIDDKYYFRWCLEFYKSEQNKRGILKEDFIFCIKRYKFTDINDFNDFCSEISYKHSLYDNARFNLDCVSALLDACDGINSLKEGSYSFFYMQKIISEIKNQELTNKINEKFNLHPNENSNNDQSNAKTMSAKNLMKGKTPLWLIIITFGGVFWGPWLFKKIFGCCYNFEDDNIIVIANEYENQESSNQNSIPNQGNNLEESLNNGENKFE